MSNLISLKNNEQIHIINKINNYDDPEKIYIPTKFLENNIKMKEYVYKNTYFKNYICSISGYVSGVDSLMNDNSNEECLIIENDYRENINKKNKKINITNKTDLLNILEQYKLIKIKENIANIKDIKNLIISSIDEEYYTVKEYIYLVNYYSQILETIDFLIKIFNLKESLLVTKNTDFNSIKNVKSVIGTYPNITITLTPDKYLISHKEFLCKFLNRNEEDSLILTTSDIYKIYNIINGKDINSTIVTISGNAIKKSKIIHTKLGVSLKELLNKFIEISYDDYEIYINGIMQGYKINNDLDIIINDNINCIVINKKEIKEVKSCINCGACNKICPYNINVKKCFDNNLSHKKCLGCGLCNYICPVNIDLKKIVKSDYFEKEYK